MEKQNISSSRGRLVNKNPATVRLGALTHVGLKRQDNQDAFCALGGSAAPKGSDGLIIVADGMGGHSAGEIASTMAIDLLLAELPRTNRASKRIPELPPDLTKAVEHVGKQLHREAARPSQQGMGTTLTAVLLIKDTIQVAHVGDSRAYLLHHGVLQQITRDHSWVEEQVAAGLLAPAEAITHPRRNVLTQALGPRLDVKIDSSTIKIESDDLILVCTDGLYTLISDAEIATIIADNDAQDASERLVQEANSRGGNDNITVALMRILGESSVDGPPSKGTLTGSMVARVRAWITKANKAEKSNS